MSSRVETVAREAGIAFTDPNKTLGLLAFVVAFVLPVVSLPLAVVSVRRSRALGQDNFWGRIALNLSAFLFAVYAVIIVFGLVAYVIIPVLAHQ